MGFSAAYSVEYWHRIAANIYRYSWCLFLIERDMVILKKFNAMQKEILGTPAPHSLKLVLLVVLFTLSLGTSAQLAFIPDLNMRTWLNNQIPGIVNAQGNMDTAHPGIPGLISTELLALPFTGPSDLTGLEYLTGLQYLRLLGGGVALILPAFPPNLIDLEVDLIGMTPLPPLPATLMSLSIRTHDGLTSLPVLPVGLQHLSLSNLMSMTVLGPLPETLEHLWIENLPQLESLPQLPDGLLELVMRSGPIDQLPVLPTGMELLELRELIQLRCGSSTCHR